MDPVCPEPCTLIIWEATAIRHWKVSRRRSQEQRGFLGEAMCVPSNSESLMAGRGDRTVLGERQAPYAKGLSDITFRHKLTHMKRLCDIEAKPSGNSRMQSAHSGMG
mmetsp:Transcript_47474/g.98902  ORF Transcript_47474/g.98902 Transcript_47474/m.98902 type:complete len:107 (-) Transcript_47474:68-388(-)